MSAANVLPRVREQLGDVWRIRESEGEVVVTSNGKPIALITPTSESSLEDDLRAVRRARAVAALELLQMASAKSGADQLTDEDIDEESLTGRRARNGA
ncbi:MAG: hypothetical protein M0Z54_01015 [Thermaerobacter sp.]|nr:hypothetical protein [Thermaerobacter sp.]